MQYILWKKIPKRKWGGYDAEGNVRPAMKQSGGMCKMLEKSREQVQEEGEVMERVWRRVRERKSGEEDVQWWRKRRRKWWWW